MTEADKQPTKSALSFKLEVDTVTGTANLTSYNDENGQEMTQERVYELLEAEHVQHWHIDDGAIKELIKKHSRNIAISLRVAERTDAEVMIQIADDAMSASIEFKPAMGGKDLNASAITQQLTEKNIQASCITQTSLDIILSKNQPCSAVIAVGKQPKPGYNSRFIALIDKELETQSTPKENPDGTIDFLAGRTYLSVSAGTPLMQRLPPTPGTPGMDVFGQIINAEPGKEIDFDSKLTGCEFASNDENLIVAAVDGHPVFQDNGVYVDDSLVLDNVGLETGHVTFDGSIHIKGDVMPDMKVVATGDIFIKGAVERAYIEAGNNITVNGGIIGAIAGKGKSVIERTSMPDEEDDDDDMQQAAQTIAQQEFECQLKAGGSIEARYANLAQLTAEKNIAIREYAFNSELDAGRNILLGQNGGKGNIVGGLSKAGHAIVAKTLGNQAYMHSHFRVGLSGAELKKMRHLKFLRRQRLDQARTLRRLLNELKEQGKVHKLGQIEINKATKIHDTLLQIQSDLKKIDQRLLQLQLARYDEDEPRICATSRCYPNCFITLNGAFRRVKEEHKAITYVKRGERISVKS